MVSTVQAPTDPGQTSSSSDTPPVNPGAVLGKNDFLNLLVAQLENQDPLSPTDDTQYMQEMTQFSTVEQLTNLNSSFGTMENQNDLSQAVSLLGRSITYDDANGDEQTGVASSVTVADDGTVNIAVGSDTIGLGDVRKVSS